MQNDLFLESPQYIFDTSSIIQLRQYYPEDIFEPLYKLILSIFKSGKIVILDLVFDELKEKEPTLYKSFKTIIPKERQLKFEKYLTTTQQIIQTYYDGKGKSHRLKADPHIIACAKIEHFKLVSEEYNSDVTKIPYVCSQEKINCINFLNFLREQNLKLL